MAFYPYDLDNGYPNDADEVMANFTVISDILDGGITLANFANAQCIDETVHGYINDSDAAQHRAAAITTAGGSDVETELASLASSISSGSAVAKKYVGYGYHASDPELCTVTVPANSAATLLIVEVNYYNITTGGETDVHLPLALDGTELSGAGGNYDKRFTFHEQYSSTVGVQANVSRTFYLNTTILASNPIVTSIDLTVQHIISLGALWGESSSTCDHFQMVVYAV